MHNLIIIWIGLTACESVYICSFLFVLMMIREKRMQDPQYIVKYVLVRMHRENPGVTLESWNVTSTIRKLFQISFCVRKFLLKFCKKIKNQNFQRLEKQIFPFHPRRNRKIVSRTPLAHNNFIIILSSNAESACERHAWRCVHILKIPSNYQWKH